MTAALAIGTGRIVIPDESPLIRAFRADAAKAYRYFFQSGDLAGLWKALVGFRPDEGDLSMSRYAWGRDLTERPVDLDLDLKKNASPAQNITYAQLVFPTDGGYAPITLSDATWSQANPNVYPEQTFTAGTTPTTWTGITGYAVSNKHATQKIWAIEEDTVGGPYTFNEGDTYKITLNMTHI